MRWFAAMALVLVSFTAQAGNFPGTWMTGITGNDTGGVMQWVPQIAHVYRDIAADYCAQWNRVSRITSVHARYGDFIGFVCLYDRRYDPRKEWLLGW